MSYVLDAAIVSIDGVLVVAAITGSGIMLTKVNVLPKQILNTHYAEVLSKMSVALLIPCLLFCDMVRHLTVRELEEFAIILLFATIHITVGSGVGWVFAKMTGAYPNLQRLMMVCVGFQDTTAIPLVFATVLGDNSITSNDSDFAGKATDYVLIYSVFIIVYKWTVAYALMERQPEQDLLDINKEEEQTVTTPPIGFWAKVKKIMNPPIYASLAAIPLALIPYVNEYVISGSGSVLGQNLFEAAVIIGSTAAPIIDIVLGVNLSRGIPPDSDISTGKVVLLIVGKLAIMPILGFGLIYLFTSVGLMVLARQDKILAVMMMIIYAGPTSLQVLMICADHKNQVSNISKVYLIMYLSSVVPLTLWTVVALVAFYE